MYGAGTGYGKSHTPVKEFTGKLSRIKSRMFTESGKKIAEERHRFTLAFFRQLEKEIKGEV